MTAQLAVIIIVCIMGIACALPGCFFVLKKQPYTSDVINHSILVGIFFAAALSIKEDSPLTIMIAVLATFVITLFKEFLDKHSQDAVAVFIVSAVFGAAVIILSFWHINIDFDTLIFGELVFAPLERLFLFGRDFGVIALYKTGVAAAINTILIATFYKEMRLAVFDENFLEMHIPPKYFIYILMVMSAIAATAAFKAVGIILSAGFFVGPPLIASCFAKRLWTMFAGAAVSVVLSAILGYHISHKFDVSITGSILSTMGLIYILSLVYARERKAYFKRQRALELGVKTLAAYLIFHESRNSKDEITDSLDWSENYMAMVLNSALSQDILTAQNNTLFLTDKGRQAAHRTLGI